MCKNSCKCCKAKTDCVEKTWVKCDDCRRSFMSQRCCDNHKASGSKSISTCERIKRCKCGVVLDSSRGGGGGEVEAHTCGMAFCPRCLEEVVKKGHLCYMRPLEHPEADDVDENANDGERNWKRKERGGRGKRVTRGSGVRREEGGGTKWWEERQNWRKERQRWG